MIEIKDLKKSFGDLDVLKGITETIKDGEIVSIIGPSGSGKSTFLRCINLLEEPTAGHIYIDGEKLEEDYETTDIDDVGIVNEKIQLDGDEYFVLGDNRKSSEDSRNADIGNVKREYIYGTAWFVLSPKKDFGFIR